MRKYKAYICSPLSAKTDAGIKENMRKANQYAKEIAQLLNCRAAAVHGILPELLDDNNPAERELALDFGKKYLAICDMLVVCGSQVSSGMAGEIETAEALGIPIYIYVKGKLYAVVKNSINEGHLHKLRIHREIRTKTFSSLFPLFMVASDKTFELTEGIDLSGL